MLHSTNPAIPPLHSPPPLGEGILEPYGEPSMTKDHEIRCGSILEGYQAASLASAGAEI